MTIDEMQKENKRLLNVIDVKDSERIELVKKNRELQSRIDDLQSELKYRTNENKSLYTDSQQLHNEISVLNRQLDRQNNAVNDLSDIVDASHKVIDDLKTENKELKFKLKMLTKVHMNSIYGITATVYTDTDSIKETKDNDVNN